MSFVPMQRFPIIVVCAALWTITAGAAIAQEESPMRIGIIGLDTSHAPAFTKLFNQRPAAEGLEGFRVIAAYPHGSRDIESSYSRIPKYTETVRELGVEIVDSVDQLLEKVDAVLLETNDGKPHLDQTLRVFRSGKPVFIDKPVAQDLAHTVAIYRAAEQHDALMFSSSSLRFNSTVQAARSGHFGAVLGCDAYSPCALEPSHTDLYWYGIHGCEILFTCMSTGCQSVRCVSSDDQELVVGRWSDGRIGTFRGMRHGKRGYGGHAFCGDAVHPLGPHEGYQPLVQVIAEFFRSGEPPIDPAETIELYAFMQAAQASKRDGGREVTIREVMDQATRQAEKLLAERATEAPK